MKAERSRTHLRRRRLAAAVIALLSLGALAAPAQDRLAEGKKAEVRIFDSELSTCGASPRAQTSSEKVCLRGKVRAVTTEARTGRAQGGGVIEGALYSVARDTYDERGNLTLTELSDSGNGPGPVGVLFRRGVFSFDEHGRMTSSKWYEAVTDELVSSIDYAYDERGNRVKIDSWRKKPDAHHIQEFTFDAEGHEVGTSSSRLTPDGWKTTKGKRVTTVEGGLTVARSYSLEGKPRGRTEFLRDERGNTLSEELYEIDARGEEQLRWKVAYRYDERGLVSEAVYHKAEASLGARAVYEYDERGHCTSLTRYHADGTFAAAAHRRYEYDAAGNWVSFVASSRASVERAPVPYNIVRRRITYY